MFTRTIVVTALSVIAVVTCSDAEANSWNIGAAYGATGRQTSHYGHSVRGSVQASLTGIGIHPNQVDRIAHNALNGKAMPPTGATIRTGTRLQAQVVSSQPKSLGTPKEQAYAAAAAQVRNYGFDPAGPRPTLAQMQQKMPMSHGQPDPHFITNLNQLWDGLDAWKK